MHVGIGAVSHIVPVPLHPEGERKFPEQVLSGALRERVIENLGVLGIGPVKADLDARSQNLAILAVANVERIIVWPGVVSLPGVVAALKHEVGRPVIADNQDDVTLIAMLDGRQLAEVHAADPVLGNLQRGARLPGTFAQPLLADRWGKLRLADKRTETLDVPSSLALVVAKAVQVNDELRRWISADEEIELVAGPDARPRNESLDHCR